MLGEVQHDDDHSPDVLSPDVHPGEFLSDPDLPLSHFFVRSLRFYNAPRHEPPDYGGRKQGNERVEPQKDAKVHPPDFRPRPVYSHPATFL